MSPTAAEGLASALVALNVLHRYGRSSDEAEALCAQLANRFATHPSLGVEAYVWLDLITDPTLDREGATALILTARHTACDMAGPEEPRLAREFFTP